MLVVSLAITGCQGPFDGRPPAYAYKKFSDRLRALTLGVFGLPCREPMQHNGVTYEMFTGVDACLSTTAPRRYSGVWLTDFEASHFVPSSKGIPKSWRWTPWSIDLEIGRTTDSRLKDGIRASPRRAYTISFVGREVAYPARNRFGGSDRIVLVDRVEALRPIPAPRRTMMCLPECEWIK
ncbi:hypothetical protein [Sphingomonas sp.]|uniref:hypothetical protein n=1 Tax=Sphingomonas sp. TaxID=28214 RepID=UPI002DD65CE6|nr:hypothetical protein [Sphingomonas sp.]